MDTVPLIYSYGLDIKDNYISDPLQPLQLQEKYLAGDFYDLTIDGDQFFAPAFNSGTVFMLELRDDGNLKHQYSVAPLPGNGWRVAAVQGLPYVATQSSGLQVAEPRGRQYINWLDMFSSNGFGTDFIDTQVRGTNAIFASSNQAIEFWDISDPADVVFSQSVNITSDIGMNAFVATDVIAPVPWLI